MLLVDRFVETFFHRVSSSCTSLRSNFSSFRTRSNDTLISRSSTFPSRSKLFLAPRSYSPRGKLDARVCNLSTQGVERTSLPNEKWRIICFWEAGCWFNRGITWKFFQLDIIGPRIDRICWIRRTCGIHVLF